MCVCVCVCVCARACVWGGSDVTAGQKSIILQLMRLDVSFSAPGETSLSLSIDDYCGERLQNGKKVLLVTPEI